MAVSNSPPSTAAVLIVAAGRGERAGGERPKQYTRIAGKAVLAHAIDACLNHPAVEDVHVVIGAGQEALYEEAIGDRRLPPPLIGGATRQESVRIGLEALHHFPPAAVLVHDAARPFLPPAVIDRLISALAAAEGAVPALPVVDTLAHDRTEQGEDGLGAVVPRDGLVRVQTPQAFRFGAIVAAHRAHASANATDDAQLLRADGFRVATVAGDPLLEKLTYAEDFARAEARIAAMMTTRTGLGFDVHAFGTGDRVWLAGIEIPFDRALSGHSDADVALHALTDALLGAIGDGDIGSHFPPSDPQWKGADSARFLIHARDLVTARGGIIDHVDVTIICEAPKVAPHREAMRARVAEMLAIDIGRVSVKATTTERLGFTGRGEGIAAQSVATVRLP